MFAEFVKIPLQFVDFRADFYGNNPNFTKSCRINKKYQIFAEFELDLSEIQVR